MAKGGKRQGAGRTKGAKNKRTKALEAIAKHAAAGGIDPLDYMLAQLRNPKAKPTVRRWAAKEAAPYVHAKLSSVDTTVKGTQNVTVRAMTFPDAK